MGYDLKEGTYSKRPLSDDEMWKTVNWLFSTHSINETSYKFLFFKSLIDCLDQVDPKGRISFEQVFSRFTEISWNIVVKYNVRQKAITADHKECVLQQILNDFYRISFENKYVTWNKIWDEDRIKLCKKVKSACKRYVVGALYSDMNELLYSFNKKEEWIEFNPNMVQFIKVNRGIIENLNFYKWAKFYEQVNDKATEEKLAFLLSNGFARKNESIYRAMLAYEFERTTVKAEKEQLPNTIELMLVAEAHSSYDTDSEGSQITEDEYEDEMYGSYEKMREYLQDPILLINNMKKKRVGNII